MVDSHPKQFTSETEVTEQRWLVCEQCGEPHVGHKSKEAPKVFALICARCCSRIFLKLYQDPPLQLSTD
jgi:formylmethanofuran dehydrogenase subunit E